MIIRRSIPHALSILLSTAGAAAQTTECVSLEPGGSPGNHESSTASIAAGGAWVSFQSRASDLVPGDTNSAFDVFVVELATGNVQRASLGPGGAQGDGGSFAPSLSADGRFVAFESLATNLVPGDTNGVSDVFVRDLQTGLTERVSVAGGGAQASGASHRPSLSADGRFVAFYSFAPDLAPGDTNGRKDVFLHDRQSGTTELVSRSSAGTLGNDHSQHPALSGDGRFVAFYSFASNLVAGDSNARTDVFVRDLVLGTTERVSISSSGTEANNWSFTASISRDGRFVAFESLASNLVSGDTTPFSDIFVRDRHTGTTQRASVGPAGLQANDHSNNPHLSADGRYVAFNSTATNLVAGDTNGWTDVFVRDRALGSTVRVSLGSGGTQPNDESLRPSLSADGRLVAFDCLGSNVTAGDTNSAIDVFVHERWEPQTFVPACFGDGGGAPCGCSNEVAPGSASGCANGLGVGAVLAATGRASLSDDSLVLRSSFVPAQPGLFFQANNLIGSGAGLTFGDGIRCCGSGVIRLQVVNPGPPQPAAAHTTITISQRGPPGTIQPGQTKCYQHWYRDPSGSPCGSGFNLSNAVQVTWTP